MELTSTLWDSLIERMDDQSLQIKMLARTINHLATLIEEAEDGMQTGSQHEVQGREVANTLYMLTTKQHAALQMLLDGRSNIEIAKRFNVSDDTAKVYVRTIAKKYDCHTRAQIVGATLEEFNLISDDVYVRISGGLPKDWHRNYEEPDVFADLYTRKRYDPKSKSKG